MDAWWDAGLRDVFAGRDVIFAGAFPAAWDDHVERLRAAGAQRCMIFATEGAGLVPGPDVPTVVVEPPTGLALLERVRFAIDAIEHPPRHVLEALRDFDPGRRALVVGSFMNQAAELDGRPVLAYRRPEWVALEDKTTVDDLWDRAGVDRLPSEVVALADAAAAAAGLDDGAGTVWAADNREGFHGGAHLTRWVANAATEARALDQFASVCDRVRVMPFVDGIPCSVHGIVVEDGAAILRPVEMVTLRRDHDLVYAGCSSFWNPSTEVRDQMRADARRVADTLADEVDFRGTFTIDGVVDGSRFWPTELNPRWGAGLNLFSRGADVPLLLIHDLAVAGQAFAATADEIERHLLGLADDQRTGGTWTTTASATRECSPTGAVYDDDGWRWAVDDEPVSGEVAAAPSFARVAFDRERTPIGPSVGRRASDFWRFADRQLDTGMGTLAPAPDRG